MLRINGDASVPHCEVQAERVSLVNGALYRFRGIKGPVRANGSQPWRYPPADYRLIGVGLHVRTFQELVAYIGVGGPDDGRIYFTGFDEWHRNFTLGVPAVERNGDETVATAPDDKGCVGPTAGQRGTGI